MVDMHLPLAFMQACLELLDGAYVRSWAFCLTNAGTTSLGIWRGTMRWHASILIQRYECIYVDKTKSMRMRHEISQGVFYDDAALFV
jgi:hypothetical protein